MTDKSRQQEDRSSVMNGPPSSNPQLQAGLIPHFAMASDSSLGLTAHHSLAAYGIMHHQPLGMGRVPSNPPNDMGPPIFMPSLNLGVPRVATTTMNQATKQNSLNQPFMQDVPMGFPPQSLIFHPSPVRQSSQPPYLSPSSPPVNIKLASTKSGTTKPMVTKTQVVRPTPKQPTSTPVNTKLTNVAVSRPKAESPINHVTYAPGLYMLSTVSQKGSSTLSKMLMSPAHQQTSVTSSSQQKGSVDMGGAFVSHDTTAVPTSSSIGDGKGATLSDGYPGRLSDHVTTSGQSTSMAYFTDTKNERPPQPSAAHSPSSQPLPQVGLANKDKSNIIIKKGSSLTGRHIAAITNNTTLQPTSGGSMQPAYAQGTIPQTVDSVKSEYDPADTGWPHPSLEPVTTATENQTFGNQGIDKTVGSVSVPMVTAPGVMDLSTVAHSPGGGNLLGSPVRPSGLLHPQGVGTSPRPQILRKRALDSLSQGEFPLVPLSPTSDGGVASLNHIGGRPDPSDVSASPRKKPRKQNMIANDDMYASNVPDSLSSSSASSMDAPLSVEGSEESGRTSGSSKSTRSKRESIKDGAPMEVEIRYLSQLRRSPYPISSLHKVCHKAPPNHFKQHSDIKRRDKSGLSAVEMASDRYALQRAEGWRVHHVLKQVKEMSSVEQELLEVAESLRSFSDDMRASKKCVIETEYLDNFQELVECNSVRSSRILSHMESTRTKSLQLLEHRPQVTELLVKCSPPSPLLPHLFTNHHTTS